MEKNVSSVAKQIDARMKAMNFSILKLESISGIRTHAVRNILRGKSKNPSAVNLQAIADVLNCSVKDLLSPLPYGEGENLNKDVAELMKEEHQCTTMIQECAEFRFSKSIRKVRDSFRTLSKDSLFV